MKLLGAIISGVGIFIAGASGLCSLFLILTASRGNSLPYFANGLLFATFFGGIPFAIGMGLVWAGRTMVASANAANQSQSQEVAKPQDVSCDALATIAESATPDQPPNNAT